MRQTVNYYPAPEKPVGKSNEDIKMEFKEASELFIEKLAQMLHYGSFSINRMSRGFDNNRFSWLEISVVDGMQVYLHPVDDADYSNAIEVNVTFPDNPVNNEMLDAWDKQLIFRDIDFYQKKLDALKQRAKELGL